MKILTFVKEKNNLVKRLEKVHVLIAILLNLVEQNDLRLCRGCKGREQSGVLLQVAQSLVLKQVFFLVPFNGRHHTVPNLIEKIKIITNDEKKLWMFFKMDKGKIRSSDRIFIGKKIS